jgi:hypothetical protein
MTEPNESAAPLWSCSTGTGLDDCPICTATFARGVRWTGDPAKAEASPEKV